MNGNKNKSPRTERMLQERLLDYAVRIIGLCQALPRTEVGDHIRKQMLRSGTSAGANYSEANGAESLDDFIHKMGITLKELRESYFWLRVVEKARLLPPRRLKDILQESDELIAMTVSSIVTARKRRKAR